jgi:hypothetical protein
MDFQLIPAGQIQLTTWLLRLRSRTTTSFTKRPLRKLFRGKDSLPNVRRAASVRQRHPTSYLIKDGAHWRAGEEIEQIGVIQQDLVDLLGSVINKVHR